MNVYEAMRVVRNEFVPHTIDAHLAMDEIEVVADAYNALAPDWANAPDWAQWYVINADDEAVWFAKEPAYDRDGWHVIGVTNASYCESADLPLGIDWRLCKWGREAAQ